MVFDFRSNRRRQLDRKLLECKPRFTGRVLDIGGGRERGHFSEPNESNWITVDIVDEFEPTVLGDATKLPVQSGSVDSIKCTEVLEHVEDPDSVIEELSRVLKPGGTLVLSMPFNYRVHGDPHDYQRFTEHKLRTLLSKYFKVEKIEAQGAFFTVLSDMVRGLIINLQHPIKKGLYPILPILNLIAQLDDRPIVQQSNYLCSFTTGYIIVATKRNE